MKARGRGDLVGQPPRRARNRHQSFRAKPDDGQKMSAKYSDHPRRRGRTQFHVCVSASLVAICVRSFCVVLDFEGHDTSGFRTSWFRPCRFRSAPGPNSAGVCLSPSQSGPNQTTPSLNTLLSVGEEPRQGRNSRPSCSCLRRSAWVQHLARRRASISLLHDRGLTIASELASPRS